MRTLLKTAVVVGLLLTLTGTAQALILTQETDLGVPGVDPLIDMSITGPHTRLGTTTYFVTGGGSDIGGTDDHGRFVYEELVGDGVITAQVATFFPGASTSRKGGVMIRDSLDADSANVANFRVAVAPNRDQRRLMAGADTSVTDPPPPGTGPGAAPWVRIERAGDIFTFSYSATGAPSSWTPYAETADVRMSGTVFVGLAVTSHFNPEAVTVRFAGVDVSGFQAPTLLTWDHAAGGDGNWHDLRWLGGPPNVPDSTTEVLLDTPNTDRVTVAADATALGLTVKGGEIEIGLGRTLKVFGPVDFQPGTNLSMKDGATLDTNGGGMIDQAINIVGNVTIDTAGDLEIANFGANLFDPGDLTKLGPGTLQLDNSAGGVVAPKTTFHVEDGVLASKGTDPLGGADGLVLDGGDAMLEGASAISMPGTAVEVLQDATLEVVADDAALGALTIGTDGVTLTTSGGPGGVSFDGTAIPVGAATFSAGIDTATGAITAPGTTITKNGSASLIVQGVGDLTGASFVVNDGSLIGVATSNPLEGADLELSSGELVLANASGAPAVFDNPVTVSADSTLIGAAAGVGMAGQTVVLGGASGVTLDGNNLEVQSTDGYNLDIAGALADTGGQVEMIGGMVNLSGGGGGASLDLRVRDGTLSTSDNLLTLDDARVHDGTLSVGAELDVRDNLEVFGGLVETSAPLSAEDVSVSGGTVTTGAPLSVANQMQITGGTVNTGAVADIHSVVASGGELHVGADMNVDTMEVTGDAVVGTNSQVIVADTLKIEDTLYVADMEDIGVTRGLVALYDFAQGADSSIVYDVSDRGTPLDLTISDPGKVEWLVAPTGPYLNIPGPEADEIEARSGVAATKIIDAIGLGPDATNAITVEAWVNPLNDTQGGPARMAGISLDGGNRNFSLTQDGDDYQMRLRTTTTGNNGTSPSTSTTGGEVVAGALQHVVYTRDAAGNAMIYIDGSPVSVNNDAIGGDMSNWNDSYEFVLANEIDKAGNREWLGEMHLVAIYKDALTADEVLGNFTNGPELTVVDLPDPPQPFKASGDDFLAGLTIELSGRLKIEQPSAPSLYLPDTNLDVAADSFLNTDVAEAELGDLMVAGGTTLELVPETIFANVTAGDGASIVGDVSFGEEVSVGSSCGVLDVIGDLTLGGSSVYAWDLESACSDVINVSEKLTLKDGWTLKVNTSEPFGPGDHLLFTYGTTLVPAAPIIDVSGAPLPWQWRKDDLSMTVGLGGNVYLHVVPEPSTWMLLLAAGAIGLFAYVRRRRRG